jgi:LmbE family N-acetylglucosaminyl deacetylase
MQVDSPHLDILVPDGSDVSAAAARTTHLGIGAHPDDLEIIAIHGILTCHASQDHWFSGVVTCDGAGSPRAGAYADLDDREMAERRREEQRQAATLGRYSLQLQLGYSSSGAREGAQLADALARIIDECRPDTIYLHNLADAHATHRAVARASLEALRQIPASRLPREVYGVEVWRSLDWLPAEYRVALPVCDPGGLQEALLRCHDSQVGGGKRYDLAILARQRANATLAASHQLDSEQACVLAMDLTPLVHDRDQDPREWLQGCIESFRQELLT